MRISRFWFWIRIVLGGGASGMMFAASVSPTDASSNLSAWAEQVGFTTVPSWLTAQQADTWALCGGASVLPILIAWQAVAFWKSRKQNTNSLSQAQERSTAVGVTPIEPPNWTPIWRAIAYVVEVLGAVDKDQEFPEARKALRQAALNGSLTLRGRRKIVEDRGPLDNHAYSTMPIPIPKEDWETTELNVFSPSELYVEEPTASPEWIGEDQIGTAYYKQVQADMTEIEKLWPQCSHS